MKRAAVPAILVLTLAGCGVPIESEPRPVPSQTAINIQPSTRSPIVSGSVTETLYLVKGGLLVPVPRKVAAEPEVSGVVADLLAGPTDAEKGAGIGSALLGSKVITAVQVHDGTATVELAVNLEGTGRNDDVLAFGQIVCTLTTRPGIAWATFTRGGQRIEVPRGDGSLTADPLNAASYSRLIALR